MLTIIRTNLKHIFNVLLFACFAGHSDQDGKILSTVSTELSFAVRRSIQGVKKWRQNSAKLN